MAHSIVRSLFRRHNRLLTFVGALIVFVTFIVKEGLQERLRSVVDSLNSADRMFSLKQDNSLTHSKLDELKRTTDRVQKAVEDHDGLSAQTMKAIALYRDITLGLISKLNGLTEAVANIRRALNVVPNQSALNKRLAAADLTLATLKDREPALETQATTIAIAFPKTEQERALQEERLSTSVEDLASSATLLEYRLTDLAKDTLQAAETYRDDRETSYKNYSNLSYALYILGWGLGLVGRLYGAGDLTE